MSIDKTSQYHYRLGLNQPAGSPTVRRITEMAEAIIRETDGEFLIEVFPESRLGPDPKMFADLRNGALEFFIAGATLGEVAPTSALPLLPFAFRESKAVFAALDGALGDQIRSELEQNGIHAFRYCLQNGFHHLTTSTRPIHTAADLAGLKIRSPGGAIARDFFAAFGAEAGYVPFNQMYDALEGAQLRRSERPARCRVVAAAL
jgi:TRAP-type C4-dicarboxylate transport system substrate-binding protein